MISLINDIDIKTIDENTIFTYGNQCRYLAENNTLTKVNDGGNVIGCFYIKNYKEEIMMIKMIFVMYF